MNGRFGLEDRPHNAVPTVPSLEMAAIWHRRKWLALPILLASLSVTVPVARSLPTIYESTATVLVGRQQDPEHLAGPFTPWAADELEARLRALSQQILSRSRLYELITRFDLYRELRQRAGLETVVEQMRRDIRQQFKGVKQSTVPPDWVSEEPVLPFLRTPTRTPTPETPHRRAISQTPLRPRLLCTKLHRLKIHSLLSFRS